GDPRRAAGLVLKPQARLVPVAQGVAERVSERTTKASETRYEKSPPPWRRAFFGGDAPFDKLRAGASRSRSLLFLRFLGGVLHLRGDFLCRFLRSGLLHRLRHLRDGFLRLPGRFRHSHFGFLGLLDDAS